jgi:hypothetical protein
MKIFNFLVIISTVFVSVNALTGQKSVRLFMGVNHTSTDYKKFSNNLLVDSVSYTKDDILLPSVGFDYDIPIFKRMSITTGLGINIMGTSNYNDKLDQTLIDSFGNDQLKDYFAKNKDLKITYLRVPLLFKYNLGSEFYVLAGYAFNYSIRKTQNILAAGELNVFPPKIGFIYRNYHHAANFGIRKDWKHLSLSANYHLGISRIFDTEDFRPNERAYLTLSGFQFSIGYLIRQ